MDSNSFWFGFEPIFMHWLQSHMGTAGMFAAVFFTYLSEPIFVIALMCLLYWCIDKEKGKKIGENERDHTWSTIMSSAFVLPNRMSP